MKCVRCGVDLPTNIGIITDGKVVCPRCSMAFGTCAMCKNADNCEFMNNPDPMPKMITQTIRQGNMTIQQPAMNPERVKKFCVNCSCYDDESGCYKENGCCSNYNEIEL